MESGHEFDFHGEISLRAGIEEEMISTFISNLINIFAGQECIQVGAMTSFGFGQLQLVERSFYWTGLLQGQNYFDFLIDTEDFWQPAVPNGPGLISKTIIFNMHLIPTTPLFIGGGKPYYPDTDDASLTAGANYILSAKSMKGATRHQAYRIAHTIHDADVANDLCDEIFGTRDGINITKSKFWTTDATIIKVGDKKPQPRVAIDRFTGGAIESALFSKEPVWPTSETTVDVEWRLYPIRDFCTQSAAVGLLLLVARDLMNEMLPIGGEKSIGRGRFQGEELLLSMSGNNYSSESGKFDEFINSFLNYKTNGSC